MPRVHPKNGRNHEPPSLNSMGFLLLRAQSRLRDAIVEALEGSSFHPGHLAVLVLCQTATE